MSQLLPSLSVRAAVSRQGGSAGGTLTHCSHGQQPPTPRTASRPVAPPPSVVRFAASSPPRPSRAALYTTIPSNPACCYHHAGRNPRTSPHYCLSSQQASHHPRCPLPVCRLTANISPFAIMAAAGIKGASVVPSVHLLHTGSPRTPAHMASQQTRCPTPISRALCGQLPCPPMKSSPTGHHPKHLPVWPPPCGLLSRLRSVAARAPLSLRPCSPPARLYLRQRLRCCCWHPQPEKPASIMPFNNCCAF